MEATARGAKEVGGATIGVTIGLYRNARPNPWLDQEIAAESLFHRLEELVTLGQAFVILRGAIGTLLELCLVWNLSHFPQWGHKPIVIVGPEWQDVAARLRANLPFHPWEWNTLTFVATVDEAVEYLASRYPWTSDVAL
jgi:predicted Rossmann-fold nucleotide-binding protein